MLVNASEIHFSVACENSRTLFGVGLEECKVAACNYSSAVFHHLGDVCEVLLCGATRREELKLQPVTSGWNIYFKTEVPSPGQTGIDVRVTTKYTDDDVRSYPVSAIIVIAIVVVLCITSVVLGVISERRRLAQTVARKNPTYVNDAAFGPEAGQGVEETNESNQPAAYEEITRSSPANPVVSISSVEDAVVYYNIQEPAAYQRLAPDN